MGIKVFKDLKKEVIEQNLCNSCGACVAVCTANEVEAIRFENNFPQENENSKCLECGICYLICGRIHVLDTEMKKIHGLNPPIGNYKYLTFARTTSPKLKQSAQDGGVVTSIMKYLLEKNLIDAALVNIPIENWESIPNFINNPKEIMKTAGTRYSAIPAVEELGNYKNLENKRNPRLAFVGTPCQIVTIRKMQLLNAKPGVFVKYLIGLFCMENFHYDALMKGKIQNEMNIDLNDIEKLNIKGKFIISLKNKQRIELSLKELNNIVRNNCHYCEDFTNFYADISVGGVGAPRGYSTVLVRNSRGEKLFSKLIIENAITELAFNSNEFKDLKTKALAQLMKMGEIKYRRGTEKKRGFDGKSD
ncbi:MAG: Coenzyme F420 hydrogenase/dehydrogenase, beta subunit C-terminal domain [Candidatus Helarchaeota archaeon]